MNITVISPPPFEPITLADLYSHLRLDTIGSPATHPHDVMLAGYITSARQSVEKDTRRSLVQQTLRLTTSAIPSVGAALIGEAPRQLRLYRPPSVSIVSVSYYDSGNALVTVPSTDYYLSDDEVPQLRFTTGYSAPALYDRPDALRVEYVAGYEPSVALPTTQAEYAANVPQPLKDAVKLGVQVLYDSIPAEEFSRIMKLRDALLYPYTIQHAI